MSNSTETLGELRAEIDALDESLHDLLIRRAEITRSIAKVKRPATQGDEKVPPAIRPAREAQIIRHLLAHHKGDLPRRVIVRIWREIIAASLQAQTKFHVHVYTGEGEGQGAFGDLVHAHFGSLTPVREHSRAAVVVQECAEEIDSLGVVPFPEMADEGVPWWAQLAPPGQAGPRIIAKQGATEVRCFSPPTDLSRRKIRGLTRSGLTLGIRYCASTRSAASLIQSYLFRSRDDPCSQTRHSRH
jgi:chorismate mutase-like protein